MLSEVVSKITTLFKGALAAWIAALEQKLGSCLLYTSDAADE